MTEFTHSEIAQRLADGVHADEDLGEELGIKKNLEITCSIHRTVIDIDG